MRDAWKDPESHTLESLHTSVGALYELPGSVTNVPSYSPQISASGLHCEGLDADLRCGDCLRITESLDMRIILSSGFSHNHSIEKAPATRASDGVGSTLY